jgi:hypothetical protein
MPQNRSDRTYLKRSLAVSGGLHLLLLPLLIATLPAMLGWAAIEVTTPFSAREATTISYLTIEHRVAPAPRPAARREPARSLESHAAAETSVRTVRPIERAVKSSFDRAPSAPARHVTASRPAADAPRTVAVRDTAVVRPRSDVSSLAGPSAIKEQAVVQPPSSVVAAPAPTPSPSPSATAAAPDPSSARLVDVPAGGWGQNFERPIVADDADLADLHSRYHDVARASIDIDDAGHATRVVLPAGLTDDQRADIERRLMAIHYIPAECNGLHCAGTLLLTL